LSVTACSTILLWNVGLLVFFGLLQSCFGCYAGLLLIGCCLMQRWYVVFSVCLQILLLPVPFARLYVHACISDLLVSSFVSLLIYTISYI